MGKHHYGIIVWVVGALLCVVALAAIAPYRMMSIPSPTLVPTPSIAGVPVEFQGRLSLFILAGQSNISGRGTLSDSPTVHPRVFVFGNDYLWKIAMEPVDSAENQMDLVSVDVNAGAGPALPFALSLLERNPEMIIGLVPCAKGGSSIEQWQRDPSAQTLYGSCLQRARVARKMGEIKGMLFWQGETDALDPHDPENRIYSLHAFDYAIMFTTFVNDWRSDLPLGDGKILPIVFAQIGTTTTQERFPNWNVVKDQQGRVLLPCVAMIAVDDLPLEDLVHYATSSYTVESLRNKQFYGKLWPCLPTKMPAKSQKSSSH